LSARSNASGLSSISTSRAVSMKRLNCSELSGFGVGFRGISGWCTPIGRLSSPAYRGLGYWRFERLSATSCFIRQPLSFDAIQGDICASRVIKPKRNSIVIAEVDFSKIPFQVLLADVMIYAIDATLQYRKISFYSVSMCVTPNVLLCRVVHGLMTGEALADLRVNGAFVGTRIRPWRNLFLDYRTQISGGHVGTWKDATRPLRSTKATTGSWRDNFSA
jgi:hypothetical protein